MNINTTFGDVTAIYEDGVLTVSNAFMERQWQWTGKGLATTRVTSMATDTIWTHESSGIESDWLIPGYEGPQDAELTNISATVSDDEGFTSKHIEVVAEISYPAANLDLRLTIWAYPNTPGMRTQVSAKAVPGYDPAAGDAAVSSHQRVDFMPLTFGNLKRRMFGYYNETQQRNDPCEDILKEETVSHPLNNREFHTWPSALWTQGVILLSFG